MNQSQSQSHNKTPRSRTLLRNVRGVSLIEALLALVVMALGMLAVVGVQANLRATADLSRQRAEAVRLAQEGLETWRSFSNVTAVAGDVDYTDIVSDGPIDVSPLGSNATFERTRTVPADPASGSPPLRSMSVRVQWNDRAGTVPQPSVELHTMVARVSPEVAASLSVPPNGVPARQPLGRHSAIPRAAVWQPDGTSIFTPPQAAGPVTRLVFNNITGLITSICVDLVCTAGKAQLLTGYLRMALGVPLPMPAAQVLNPPTTANGLEGYLNAPGPRTLEVKAHYSSSADGVARTSDCYMDPLAGNLETAVSYYCVLRLYDSVATPSPSWTGSLHLGPSPSTVADAVAANAINSKLLRVCRYYDLVGNGGFANIEQPLSNKNLLLIPAGNDVAANTCPAALTAAHQPI